MVGALREAYPDELLDILVAEKNIGNSTYDGIEVGGERVAQEIEDRIAKLKEEGKTVDKMSITGYSLGGLVSRYVIGLLYTRGVFDKIKPMVGTSKYDKSAWASLTSAEFHDICYTTSWCTIAAGRLAQRHMEQPRRKNTIDVRHTALHSRHFPRYWTAPPCCNGRSEQHIRPWSIIIQTTKSLCQHHQ